MREVSRLLDIEVKKLGDSKKVYLAGYSVGCSIAIATYLRYKHRLGGVVGASGLNCAVIDWKQVDIDVKRKVPFLLYHGQDDPIFDFKYAGASY